MAKRLVIAGFPIREKKIYAAALFEEQKAVALVCADPANANSGDLGSIYLGRIDKIQQNLGAAFVRYGPDQTGFLPIRTGDRKVGDLLLVQVEKEAIKTKLPRLTTKLSISGRNLAVVTGSGKVHFSKKLTSGERSRLQNVFAGIPNVQMDTIVRTNARDAAAVDLAAEWEEIQAQFRGIIDYGCSRTLYSCLYRKEPAYLDLLNELSAAETARIVTDEKKIFEELMDYRSRHREFMRLPEPVYYEDPMVDLYKLYNLSTLFAECTAKQVWLKSGGSIVIEQTEAFVCIDVNTGRYSGKKASSELVRLTNREAVEESVRQIRLRNLSGSILIDLINLHGSAEQTAEYEQEICTYVTELFRTYRIPAKVIDITGLGILEIACRKTGKSLKEQLEEMK